MPWKNAKRQLAEMAEQEKKGGFFVVARAGAFYGKGTGEKRTRIYLIRQEEMAITF